MKFESDTIRIVATCQVLSRNCTNHCCPCCSNNTSHSDKCIRKSDDGDPLHMSCNNKEIKDESWQDVYRANGVTL